MRETAWQYYRTDGRVADDALRTLEVRVKEHAKTALAIAQYLEGHTKVRKVYYTGLASHPQRELIIKQQSGHTGLLGSFELESTTEQAKTFCQALKIFKIGVSWGGYESLVTMPYARETEETPGRWERTNVIESIVDWRGQRL